MNPGNPENSAGPSTISPSYSPLHPASVQHNTLILNNLCTLTSVFSGTLAGILGLLNLNGFFLYIFASLFNAGVIALLKCRNEKTGKVDLERFLPSLHDVNDTAKGWRLTVKAIWSLMGVGQENLLTFLLFWIGFYVRSHRSSGRPFGLINNANRFGRIATGHHTWFVHLPIWQLLDIRLGLTRLNSLSISLRILVYD